MSQLSRILEPYGITEDGSVYVVFVVYLLGLCGLFIGGATRTAAIVTWLCHLTLFESSSFSSYGVDSFINIALFYCVIMPRGAKLSIYQLIHRESVADTVAAGMLSRMLQLHMCVIYLSAGIAKVKGSQWWNGEAIWRSVTQPQFHTYDLTWLASIPILAVLASWGTLLIELGYAVFIWPRRTRAYWLGATVGLHLSIAVILGLTLFGVVLIVLNVAAFGWQPLQRAWSIVGVTVSRRFQSDRALAAS